MIRSVALGLLVALSMTLSVRLWMGENRLPSRGAPSSTVPDNLDALPSPGEVLAPQDVVVHLGQGRHTGLTPGSPAYAKFWGKVEPLLAGLPGAIPMAPESGATAQEVAAQRDEPGLEVSLPLALPLEQWADLWNSGWWTTQTSPSTTPSTRRVLLAAGKNPAAYVWVEGSINVLRASLPGGARLQAILKDVGTQPGYVELSPSLDGLRIDPGIYVPDPPPRLAVLHAIRRTSNPEDYARRFFLDLSVVRMIKERDSAVIFTDGRQGLRVYPSGASEYTSAQTLPPKGELTFPEALRQAVEYIAVHGGWPPQAYLVGNRTVDAATALEFTYRLAGLPLEGQPPLQITLNSAGVISFQRWMWEPSDDQVALQPAIGAEEALATVSRNWQQLFPWNPEPRITDVRLAYLLPPRGAEDSTLRPVWAVTIHGGHRAYVDALTGELAGG